MIVKKIKILLIFAAPTDETLWSLKGGLGKA
jgi:hypothetical protein